MSLERLNTFFLQCNFSIFDHYYYAKILFLRFKYSFTLEVQVTLHAALTQYSTLDKMEKQET